MQEEFADYYFVLELSPSAEAETIHRVYRLLAVRHHPDNTQTVDLQKFLLLQKAQLMTIPREHLLFGVWHLKQKQFPTSQGGAGEPQDAM